MDNPPPHVGRLQKAGVWGEMRPWPPSASPRFTSGQNSVTGHEKGAGRMEIAASGPSFQVGPWYPTQPVVSRASRAEEGPEKRRGHEPLGTHSLCRVGAPGFEPGTPA